MSRLVQLLGQGQQRRAVRRRPHHSVFVNERRPLLVRPVDLCHLQQPGEPVAQDLGDHQARAKNDEAVPIAVEAPLRSGGRLLRAGV